MSAIKEVLKFFLTLTKSCLFAGTFFACLAFGKYITTFWLHFYDFLFVCVILTQIIFLLTKIETWDEVKIIMIYHILWFAMEAFKTSPAIWARSYPNPWFFTLLWVPLFSGFMYSAIGSFIFKAWKNLNLKFTNFPSFQSTIPIDILIYINFFSHHFIPDFRYLLLIPIFWVARKTKVWYHTDTGYKSMHVLLWLFLVWFCIWWAENIATFFGAWMYPSQIHGRQLVSFHKILSRFLLFIVSFGVVSVYVMKWGKNLWPYLLKKESIRWK